MVLKAANAPRARSILFPRSRAAAPRPSAKQRGDAGGCRGQCELAAGDEIELARLPPDFQHDGAERIAGQRVGGGPQRGVGVGRAHGHQQPRIEA
jgi:hypothetical protein